MRGFFEIGILHPQHSENIGTLWRSAYQLGAAGIFTIGGKIKMQHSDTYKSWRHIPLRTYPTLQAFLEALPYSTQLVGVEFPGVPLAEFEHPQRAIYLLGSENNGLSKYALEACVRVAELPAVRQSSYNVAVAGSLVMYDRFCKNGGEP